MPSPFRLSTPCAGCGGDQFIDPSTPRTFSDRTVFSTARCYNCGRLFTATEQHEAYVAKARVASPHLFKEESSSADRSEEMRRACIRVIDENPYADASRLIGLVERIRLDAG